MDVRITFIWYNSDVNYACSIQVPFFYAHDEFPRAAKGHYWVIARESPKAWVSNPTLVSSPIYNMETTSPVNSDGASEISPGNGDGY